MNLFLRGCSTISENLISKTFREILDLVKDRIVPVFFHGLKLLKRITISWNKRKPANSSFGYTKQAFAKGCFVKSKFNVDTRAPFLVFMWCHRFQPREQSVHTGLSGQTCRFGGFDQIL